MTEHKQATGKAMQELAQLMIRLRAEDGCPWDRRQSWSSLTPYTIEEAYEVVEAVEKGDPAGLQDELGDLLFHVVFYSRIAEEENHFNLTDVIQGITRKMTRRHPHVFNNAQTDPIRQADEIPGRWEEIKRQEREEKRRSLTNDPTHTAQPVSVFDDINSHLPALLWAAKVQRKMGQVGFDWTNADEVLVKFQEEMEELQEARKNQDIAAMTEEMGDLLFTLVNLARHLKINPETALRQSTHKCQHRFRFMETHLHAEGRRAHDASLEELESLWQQSKHSAHGTETNS